MWPALSARRVAGPFVALVALAALIGLVGPTAAQEGKRVKVTVLVIVASERCDRVEPCLKCIADEVRKLNPSLRGFALASMACRSLTVEEKASLPLVEGVSAEVLVHCCGDHKNRVTLAVTPPLQGEIVYRTVCGKFLPIVTRYQCRERVPPRVIVRSLAAVRSSPACGPALAAALLLEGCTRDRLILAVRVQPCKRP